MTGADGPLAATALKCEHLASPRGLNTPAPRFSWACEGAGRNRAQTAYRIVAGTSAAAVAGGRGDLWDSGRVQSSDSLLIPYGGAPLASHTRFHWSVQIWDEGGRASGFAAPAPVETGLTRPEDWRARWIGRPDIGPAGRQAPAHSPYDNPYQARPADYLRRRFGVARPVRRAMAYASALGVYRLHLNGQVVGDEVLAPGWTDYHQRVEYQLYDVTELMADGDNVVAAVVGEGWYCGRVGNTLKRQGAHYGPKPAFLCQLIVDYADGTRDVVATDRSWRAGKGPIAYSDLLMGEKYDARLETPGWDTPGFDDGEWDQAETIAPWPRPPQLDAARAQPVRRTVELPATFLHRTADGRLIYDLGQNIAGWVRLCVEVPAGTAVTLRHGEALDGEALYTANLRSAQATDVYVAAGSGREVFEPSFTFHGFRYVEVNGNGLVPERLELTGIQVNSDTPPAGVFECGSEVVNRLVTNIAWSLRGNFLSVPTDCPQRDERLGWLADAQVIWRTAACNADVAAFFTKWMQDIADAQQDDGAFTDVAPSKAHWAHNPFPPKGAPAWGDGAVVMVWVHWCWYADRGLVERHWRALERWLDYIARHNPDGLRENALNRNYGDWLSVGAATDKVLIATAYWAHIADLMARLAGVLGLEAAQAHHRAQYEAVAAAFRRRFVSADGQLTGDTQTGYLLALDFGLLDPGQRDMAARHLVRKIAEAGGHLATGFLGVRHLCPVLADLGASDLAYTLLLNETYPSWGFSVRHGATTIWERWDGWTPDRGFQTPNMNSLNHYAYGSVGEWLYARCAGIACDPQAPGFRRVICRPLPNRRLARARATYRAHVGPIVSSWEIENETVRYDLQIPTNVTAEVHIPWCSPGGLMLDGMLIEDHCEVRKLTGTRTSTIAEIGSGDWRFTWALRN